MSIDVIQYTPLIVESNDEMYEVQGAQGCISEWLSFLPEAWLSLYKLKATW